jgi:hypothetical protein
MTRWPSRPSIIAAHNPITPPPQIRILLISSPVRHLDLILAQICRGNASPRPRQSARLTSRNRRQGRRNCRIANARRLPGLEAVGKVFALIDVEDGTPASWRRVALQRRLSVPSWIFSCFTKNALLPRSPRPPRSADRLPQSKRRDDASWGSRFRALLCQIASSARHFLVQPASAAANVRLNCCHRHRRCHQTAPRLRP